LTISMIRRISNNSSNSSRSTTTIITIITIITMTMMTMTMTTMAVNDSQRTTTTVGGQRHGRSPNGSAKQAAIVNIVQGAHQTYGCSLSAVMNRVAVWRRLVREVAGVVRVMPLWKLQTVGAECSDFLYENAGAGTSIRMPFWAGR